MVDLLRAYNNGMSKLKQYNPEENEDESGFDYDKPEVLLAQLGMSTEQETMLTTVLANELKAHLAATQKIPLRQIELRMTHVKDVKIDYDYLTELVTRLLNEVHEQKMEAAAQTREDINRFASGLEDRSYAKEITNAATAIYNGSYQAEHYPVENLTESNSIIQAANNVILDHILIDFRVKWGITDIINSTQMREMFSRHQYGMQDLDNTGQLRDLITEAGKNYRILAREPEIRDLNKIRYRNDLRQAIYRLADQMAENQ